MRNGKAWYASSSTWVRGGGRAWHAAENRVRVHGMYNNTRTAAVLSVLLASCSGGGSQVSTAAPRALVGQWLGEARSVTGRRIVVRADVYLPAPEPLFAACDLEFSGSPCLWTVPGALWQDGASGVRFDSGSGGVLDFTGTASTDRIVGTYRMRAPQCASDSGEVVLNRLPPQPALLGVEEWRYESPDLLLIVRKETVR